MEWEVSQVHPYSHLFHSFKDLVSCSAPSYLRRRRILKGTKWHIKWPYRSYCNSFWILSVKSGISFYFLITSFSLEEQSPTAQFFVNAQAAVAPSLSCYKHIGRWYTKIAPRKQSSKQGKRSCFTHSEREAVLPLSSQQESWKRCTKLRTRGKNRAGLTLSITFPQTCKLPILI